MQLHKSLRLPYAVQACGATHFTLARDRRTKSMETIYDWASVAVFAGLITLFLNRSAQDNPPDRVWHYLPPMIGCAIANQLGNHHYPWAFAAVMVGVAAYIWYVLRPGRAGGSPGGDT